MTTRLLRSAVLFFLFVSAVSWKVSAASTDAHLTGTLIDASGGSISGVHITAVPANATSNAAYTATSTGDGRYDLALPAGSYRIRFLREPFVAHEYDFTFSAGESRTLDLRLELEPLSSKVIVTAQAEPIEISTSPAPATIFTRQDIDQHQAVALADLLLFAPGVSLGRSGAEGGQTSVFLGGGNSSYTKVLVDGTPVNEPGNAVDFSNFTLDNIDKIEIVRGAESALYGTDAVAGVIQVISHRGTTRKPAVSLFSEGGSFSSGRGGAQLSGLLGKFDYSTAASYFQTGGQGPNDAFINRTLSGNFGWRFSDSHQLRLTLRNNTSDAGIPGQTAFTPPNLDQRSGLHFFSAGARWDFSTGPHWRHAISGAESYNRERNANPAQDFYATDAFAFCPQTNPSAVATAEFCDFTYLSTNKYNRAGFGAQSSYFRPAGGVSAGYQYEVENASLSFLPGNHLRRNNQGGFLDSRWSPHPRLVLSAGGRAEANGVFGTRVVPRAGVSYALHYGHGLWGDARVRAFYGQGIKEPRFDQSYGTDLCFPGNPLLRPERSRTWSAGVDQTLSSDRVRISAEYFQNRFYDIISFGSVAGIPGCGFAGTFFNTDLARSRGANVVVETKPLRWLTLVGGYTYDDTRVLASPNAFDQALTPGNRLLRRPLHSGSLLVQTAWRRWQLHLAGYFTGVRTDADFLFLGFTSNSGYARFDLATSYDFGRGISLYSRVTNLFDKKYQDILGYPALGRDARLGMKYRFGGKE